MEKVKTKKAEARFDLQVSAAGLRLEKPVSRYWFLFVFTCLLLTATLGAPAQKKQEIPKGVVPPPFSIISKDENRLLTAQKKPKKRTQLALTLMNSRLIKSQEYVKNEQFQKSLNQLGKFKALLRNTLKFLKRNEGRRGSLKNFKKFEMTLRKFLPKLELVRRQMPFKYGYHVTQLMKAVREARTAAIKPLYSDTVVPQGNR